MRRNKVEEVGEKVRAERDREEERERWKKKWRTDIEGIAGEGGGGEQ